MAQRHFTTLLRGPATPSPAGFCNVPARVASIARKEKLTALLLGSTSTKLRRSGSWRFDGQRMATCPAPGGSYVGVRGWRESRAARQHRSCNSGSSNGARGLHTHASLQIDLVPCLSDNYAYLLVDDSSSPASVAIVDPSEAGPVVKALTSRGLQLTHVLCTHHHWDHTGGNNDLKRRYGAQVVGPKADESRIPGIDVALAEGQTWQFGRHTMHVLDTPGHTRGHVSFYFPEAGAVFTGDTMFSLGCGRLFEGSPPQMWASLSKLAKLPPETRIYCGHEYTQSNVKFALSLEPGNNALQARAAEVKHLREQGLPTIPSTLREELAVNPFLRPGSMEIRRSLKLSPTIEDVDSFAAIRRAKDLA